MTDIDHSQISATSFERALAQQDRKHCQTSMIYHVLPSVVQSRIPTLPSIRRSLSDIRGKGLYSKGAVARGDGNPESPPPSYSSTPGHVSPTQATELEDFDFHDDISERPLSSSMNTPLSYTAHESKTGINWKYATQGISLLTQASRESVTPKRDTDTTSTSLTRQLYIHGMTYLLRGIPTELTAEETLSIQAALPENIIDLQTDLNAQALIPATQNTATRHERQPTSTSVLHRITATLVFQTFVFIQFLLPYIKLFVGHAYRFERQHKITQRFVANSIVTIDELGKRGLQLSQTVCQMNDGKVGQVVNEIAFYCVEGLTGGFQQGMTEGVTMISDRPYDREQDDWRRRK